MEKDNSELDKRPWLMDWLFGIGHDMAIINHCYEKIQYLNADLKNGNGKVEEIVDRLNHYHEIRRLAYKAYDLKMSYIFDEIPEAHKDDRCLLKHGSTDLILAQETSDALDNGISDENLKAEFEIFAGIVSLALGIEFKTCMRCLYDGFKKTADKIINKKDSKESKVHKL